MKVLKIILILAFLGAILLFGILWLAFRTKSENISSIEPYKSLVGKTVNTKQICYIAKNRKAGVNQNPYSIKMTSRYFDEEVKEIYTLPLGTSLIIEDAKAFISPASSLQRKYILGQVYVKELDKTVPFEMYWDPSYAGYPEYPLGSRNDLMPWHDEILGRKYYSEAIKDASLYPAQIKDPIVAARFRNTTHYTSAAQKNEVVADYTTANTVYEHDWNMGYIDDKQFSIRVLVPKDEITKFQLNEVFLKLNVDLDKVVFSNELMLSPDYYTLIAIKFTGQPNNTGKPYSYTNKENFISIESALINYDLYGKKIDHILLSSQTASDSNALKQATVANTLIKIKEQNSLMIKAYEINELGKIVLKE